MRRLVLLALVLLTVCGGFGMPAAANDKEKCVFKYLSDTAAQQELISACTRLIDSKKFSGDDLANLYNSRAFAHQNAGRHDLTIADADEVIGRIAPRKPRTKLSDDNLHMAHYLRGESNYSRKDYQRAIADQTVAIQIRPTVAALHSRGEAYYETGQFDRAIDDFSAEVLQNPKRSLGYTHRALSFEKKGEWAKALADARKAVELEPNGYSGMSERTIERVQQAMKPDSEKKPEEATAAAPAASPIQDLLTNHVVDDAGILDAALIDSLTAKLTALKAKTSDHVLFLTIKSLEGFTLEEGARELAERSPLGGIKKNAVVIVIAPNQRKAHIEVFSGLERALTKQMAKTILDDTILASFSNGAFASGVERGVDEVIQVLTRAHGEQTQPSVPAAPEVVAVPLPPSPPPAVVAAVAPSPALSNTPKEIRVALVIGNGNYKNVSALPNPANDAADISAALRKLGFDVVEGRDLDKRAMEDKVREFSRKLDRASLALFFYAGHGMQVGGRNYLVPIDAKLERPGDLSFDTLDVSQVLAQMEAEPRVNLIFLDACRDNPLARTLARSLGTRSSSVGQGLATIQSAIGTMIAYATQPDNVALDGDGRNSPFTAALLKHIGTQNLEIGSLMRRVRADVVAATRSKQVPWDHSSLMGDVVLAR